MASTVRAILPAKFNEKALMDQLVRGAKDFGPELAKAHQPTVQGWQGEKPTFTPVVKETKKGISLFIRLTGSAQGRQKWIWLNEGTRPHKIRAKAGKRLHFNVPYKAGSRPGTVQTQKGSRGESHRTAEEVQHPGTKPRKWTKIIAADMQGAFEMAMANAMRKAAKASGHGQK